METKNKKTLLIATGIYPPDVGGPATYSFLLNEELPKHGWEVKVLSFGEVRFLPKIIRHFVYAWKVFKLAGQYQIIYAQDPVSVGLPVCLACWLRRRHFVLKIVGDYAWEQGTQRFGVADFLDDFSLNYRKYSWPVKLLKRIQVGVAKQAQKIIVPSNYLKKIVSNWGISPDKIEVIYNAFSLPVALPDKEILRQKLALAGPLIVSAGRLVPWKGFSVLIEVFNKVKDQYPGIELFIIGDGPDRDLLTEKIKNLGLSDQVKLLGRLPKEKLLEHLKAADLFILNTSYEGFSHQLLEAMWCGTPIITTKVGGNPELIKSKENGLLVNYDDFEGIKNAIFEILDNKPFADQIIIKAQESLGLFSRERMIDQLIKEIGS